MCVSRDWFIFTFGGKIDCEKRSKKRGLAHVSGLGFASISDHTREEDARNGRRGKEDEILKERRWRVREKGRYMSEGREEKIGYNASATRTRCNKCTTYSRARERAR